MDPSFIRRIHSVTEVIKSALHALPNGPPYNRADEQTDDAYTSAALSTSPFPSPPAAAAAAGRRLLTRVRRRALLTDRRRLYGINRQRSGPGRAQQLLLQPPAERTIINKTTTADAAGYSNCDHPSTCVIFGIGRAAARQPSGKRPAMIM